MIRVTGSRLALLSACQFWARDGVEWTERAGSSAAFGTRLHAMAEAVIEGREPACDDPEVVDVFARTLGPWLDANRRAGWRSEVPFAVDVAAGTARELPKSTHRDYSMATPSEMCLTTDLVYMAEDERGAFGCVDDLKWSGHHVDAQRSLDQLAGQAAALSRAWRVDRVRARAIRVSAEGVDDATEVYWLDVFDVAGVLESIREGLAAIPRAEPQPGDHCKDRFCPALASCPSTQALVEQVIPADALARKEWRFTPAIESPDHLERILAMVPIASEYVERVKRAAAAYVEAGPVRTSDGREIKQHYRTMTRTNTSALLDLAKSLGATDEQLALCARTAQEPNGVRVNGSKRGRAA